MIELTVMDHGPVFTEEIRKLVRRFEAVHDFPVQVQVLPWRGAWSEFVRIALYSQGPDVSEIGNTWISEFVSMNALRLFVAAETARVGGASQFLPSAWQSGSVHGHSQNPDDIWAIPWLADTRILYYRRDILERAKIDPATAFQTPETLSQTLAQLQAAGVASPWVVPSRRSRMTLHNIAYWIWGAGGDFLTPDLKQTAFKQPKAKTGMRAYFELGRYLSSATRLLDEMPSDSMFHSGEAAVTVSGPWIMRIASPVAEHIRKTLPPGTPYVGGSHLAIWKHTRQAERAVELVRFLSSAEAQTILFDRFGLFPTRLDVLDSDAFTSDPFNRLLANGLTAGRSFPPVTFWGLVETRLTAALADIWADVLSTPKPDMDLILDRHLNPIADRLDLTLSEGR